MAGAITYFMAYGYRWHRVQSFVGHTKFSPFCHRLVWSRWAATSYVHNWYSQCNTILHDVNGNRTLMVASRSLRSPLGLLSFVTGTVLRVIVPGSGESLHSDLTESWDPEKEWDVSSKVRLPISGHEPRVLWPKTPRKGEHASSKCYLYMIKVHKRDKLHFWYARLDTRG